jgi:hypothetical protein
LIFLSLFVRDNKLRGHIALRTIQVWPSAKRGEDRNMRVPPPSILREFIGESQFRY